MQFPDCVTQQIQTKPQHYENCLLEKIALGQWYITLKEMVDYIEWKMHRFKTSTYPNVNCGFAPNFA